MVKMIDKDIEMFANGVKKLLREKGALEAEVFDLKQQKSKLESEVRMLKHDVEILEGRKK